MNTQKNINEMSVQEAAKYYSSIGIVTHPLNGKKPCLQKWQRLTETPFESFKTNTNIGYVCGQVSDLTCIDIDWYVKGIWEYVLRGMNVSDWVKQAHTERKYHLLFKYCNELKVGQYQVLGFDILSDAQIFDNSTKEYYTASNNCVAAPSIHTDGNKYQISGNIETRPVIPEEVYKKINYVIDLYSDLVKRVLPKCRQTFQKLWKSVFEDKRNESYHDFMILQDRNRLLHFMAELKSNGASSDQLQLVCSLIFGENYDQNTSKKQLEYVNESKTAKTESIIADPYLCQFHKVIDEVTEDESEIAIDPLDIDYDEQSIDPELLQEAEKLADEILETNDPIEYILQTVAKKHTGDCNTIEAICISIAGQSCLNTAGIQVSVNGNSGSGKSHAVKSHLHLVPRRFKRAVSLSAKAAFYSNLRPGMIIFSDDLVPNCDMEDTIKRATTNYQEETIHLTVKDQKRHELVIPARINWYLTAVAPQVSEQLLNRQLVFETSSSHEQKMDIFNMQKQEAVDGTPALEVDLKVLVCRRIYSKIKEIEPLKVAIPFADRIELEDISNSRIFPLLLDMIRGYTIFYYRQREINEDGKLVAEIEDFWRAKKLFESRIENTLTHLSKDEMQIIQYIREYQDDIGCTIDEIAKGTGLKYKQVHRLLVGRSDRPDTGLMSKITGISRSEYTDTSYEHKQLNDKLVTVGTKGRKQMRYKIDASDILTFCSQEFVSLIL